MTEQRLSYARAINEALRIALERDPSVYVIGLGAPDPKGVFGTTAGLAQRFGPKRVLDMPVSENAMTGIVLGSAIAGMRPVLTHQRVDFALVSMEQLVNQAAKWHYMFGGRMRAPMVVRMIVGRGWGQGPQHSQSLQSWFAHVPGLKVAMPALPGDAKGMLLSAIADDNPVLLIEHRWLFNIEGPVPDGDYRVPLGVPRIVREGRDVTIAATSYMTIEALRAADILAGSGIAAEVVDVRTLNPFDDSIILASVERTGHLLVADTGWTSCGFAGEIVARVSEKAFGHLKAPPRRIALPDCPTPTSPALTEEFYPDAWDIAGAAASMLGRSETDMPRREWPKVPHDVPDNQFTGPF